MGLTRVRYRYLDRTTYLKFRGDFLVAGLEIESKPNQSVFNY